MVRSRRIGAVYLPPRARGIDLLNARSEPPLLVAIASTGKRGDLVHALPFSVKVFCNPGFRWNLKEPVLRHHFNFSRFRPKPYVPFPLQRTGLTLARRTVDAKEIAGRQDGAPSTVQPQRALGSRL